MPIHFNTGTLSTILNQVEMFVQKLVINEVYVVQRVTKRD